ncbi:hypothetical protein [Lapidilactobacillus luobeiensis]|uniref:hypothetical protein n=1 Tax=Lapidilactobacillus luobeiensis TaxID=2950371 RepID=UPI0021C27945|nr:hypothetical protein [Lapidilactobacillus luobeiensis]
MIRMQRLILMPIILLIFSLGLFVPLTFMNFNQNDSPERSANNFILKLPDPYFIKSDQLGVQLLHLTKQEDDGDNSYPPQNVLVSKVTGVGFDKDEIIFSANFELTDRFTNKRPTGKKYGYINSQTNQYQIFENRNELNKKHENLSAVVIHDPLHMSKEWRTSFYQ